MAGGRGGDFAATNQPHQKLHAGWGNASTFPLESQVKRINGNLEEAQQWEGVGSHMSS